jgi:hypothetical protein
MGIFVLDSPTCNESTLEAILLGVILLRVISSIHPIPKILSLSGSRLCGLMLSERSSLSQERFDSLHGGVPTIVFWDLVVEEVASLGISGIEFEPSGEGAVFIEVDVMQISALIVDDGVLVLLMDLEADHVGSHLVQVVLKDAPRGLAGSHPPSTDVLIDLVFHLEVFLPRRGSLMHWMRAMDLLIDGEVVDNGLVMTSVRMRGWDERDSEV